MSLSRIETILSGGEVVPQSRIEKILVGEDIEPQSRIEALLKEKLGGGGGGTEITDGIVVKEFTSENSAASAKVYCSSNKLWKYALAGGDQSQWRRLTSIELPENLTDFSDNYVFYRSSITEITLPNAVNVGQYTFYDCRSLRNVNLPKCATLGNQTFVGGAVYETINIGSIGYPCTSIHNTAFKNHSFSDTITVYTTSAYADTALTNIRNGATNATIIIKAAEATTYSGASYAAGETMITSTVEATT